MNYLTPGGFARHVNDDKRYWVPRGKYRRTRICTYCHLRCVTVHNGTTHVLLDPRSYRQSETPPLLRTFGPTFTAIDHAPLCGATTPEGWITCQPM